MATGWVAVSDRGRSMPVTGGMELRRLERFGAVHHAVVTLEAARDVGISESAWHRAIRTGTLEQMHPGVARIAGSPRTHEQRMAGAVLAVGPGAVASHRSSARLWGAKRSEADPVDIIVDRRTTSARLHGVRVHHPRDLDELRPVPRAGIPTTNPLRMLLDLGAVDPRSVPAALDHIVSNRIASPSSVRAFLTRHRKQGRHGVRALELALRPWQLGDADADSPLETVMNELVQRQRLPPVVFHPIVEGHEVDFLVVGTTVVIECDGHETHGLDRRQFEYDRIRDAELVAAGYTVLRLTWNEVTKHPGRVAKRIRAILERWAPHVLVA
jgi:very-short-patch-repair endonuclease